MTCSHGFNNFLVTSSLIVLLHFCVSLCIDFSKKSHYEIHSQYLEVALNSVSLFRVYFCWILYECVFITLYQSPKNSLIVIISKFYLTACQWPVLWFWYIQVLCSSRIMALWQFFRITVPGIILIYDTQQVVAYNARQRRKCLSP